MNKLRKDAADGQLYSLPRPLRIVAAGTLFQTFTLALPCHPAPSTVIRAHSVAKTRGGSASTLLAMLAQFPSVEAMLVASLGGDEEGQLVIRDLERAGVSTRFCKVWKGAGVPSAWVLQAADTDTRTVVNHNPLPDITHEEFVSLLGPLLAPENFLSPTVTSPSASPASSPMPSPSTRGPVITNPNSPAPFEWLHFEGRSVKTTLSNITGLDGLARERKWRSHCVFSLDVGRKGRQGIEALIPHADVLFVNKHYAQANFPGYATTPRTFLLSMSASAPPHALLVAHWGSEGAAVLSLPTKEYFQSSGWAAEEDRSAVRSTETKKKKKGTAATQDLRSVRSGSEFWADGMSHDTESYMALSASQRSSYNYNFPSESSASRTSQYLTEDSLDAESETETEAQEEEAVVDEVGSQEAFIAGMIYSLSRRICPGPPYTPSSSGREEMSSTDGGKWGLDECLRFATELAGRKARRRGWDNLAAEMSRAGWFE